MTYLWDFRSQTIAGPGPTPGLGWPEWPGFYWSSIWPSAPQCVWAPGTFCFEEGCVSACHQK